MTFMMSLTYQFHCHVRRFISPASLLSLCLGTGLITTSIAHSQNTVLTAPNYSDLDEGNGLYDTAPRPSGNLQNNASDSALNSASSVSNNGPTARLPMAPAPGQPQEKNLRNLIRGLGVHSRDVQDMVITHIATEMQFREPMRNASTRLFQAMNKPNITDAQLGVLLNDCRVAYEADKARRVETLDALKVRIGPDLTPRTESMLFLLGLEGDIVITLPTPALLTQMQREQQRLSRVVEGLKLEADSLRRERDDVKAEFQQYQAAAQAAPAGNAAKAPVNVVASAQINPNGLYAVAGSAIAGSNDKNETNELKEFARLAEENTALKKDIKRLERENSSLSRALKKAENRNEKRNREKPNNEKSNSERESKDKSEKR